MSQALNHLIQLLTLERLDDNLFRGECEDYGLPQVFGGQVVAQALSASMNLVDNARHLHSCHCYFLRAGDVAYPIIYETEILREGKSFTVVSIKAKQHNEIICQVMASFQVKEDGFEHQPNIPVIEQPEELFSENDLIQSLASMLPSPLKEKFQAERAFDVRLKYTNNPFNGKRLPANQLVWTKTNGVAPTNIRLQQCLLAYFTDFHCILTMLHPHERGFLQKGLKIATLDHCIWFHRDFNLNDWTRFELISPSASNARGICYGQVFDSKGNLVASYQQEGLIRDLNTE